MMRQSSPRLRLSYSNIAQVFCPNAYPGVVLAKAGTHIPSRVAEPNSFNNTYRSEATAALACATTSGGV
jgi:hypothetical protein